jgi:hypothetical protein
MAGQLDRKLRDKKIRPYVVIKSGELKGLKAKVLFADDNIVRLEVVARDERVVLKRDQVTEISDPTNPIGFANGNNLDCNPTNFDDATKQDMGVNLLQMQVAGAPGTLYRPDAYKSYQGYSGFDMTSPLYQPLIDR